MTFISNAPEEFANEALVGLVKAYPGTLRSVPGGIARADGTRPGKVAVVIGGGSGHYPAFAGLIGDGLADAAVCGQIFASPSTRQVLDVVRAANGGAGVFLSFGNYAGDVLHFGAAASRLRAQGMDVRIGLVTDDVASAPREKALDRRGIAGDLTVFKVAGAAAEAGANLDEVERLAAKANVRTQSFGAAFAGCTLPGADSPLFTLEPGTIGWGLGIHGEPGIGDGPLPTANEIAEELVRKVTAERPADSNGRAAVILNGLGTVKYEELFVLWNKISDLLAEQGIEPVAPIVGEFVTSLDMAGVSLTIMWLDDELEPLWLAPANTPAFQHGHWRPALSQPFQGASVELEPQTAIVKTQSEAGRKAAQQVLDVLLRSQAALARDEESLGALDAIAGDGDHGRGMTRGITAAVKGAQEVIAADGDAPSVLRRAADRWADQAGGTSGAIWGVALMGLADHLPSDAEITAEHIVPGVAKACQEVVSIGGAQVGDKTMVDAFQPAADALTATYELTKDGNAAWVAAVEAARKGAAATENIVARRGRSRVLGAKSLGVPDPGATSFAMLIAEVGDEMGVTIPAA